MPYSITLLNSPRAVFTQRARQVAGPHITFEKKRFVLKSRIPRGYGLHRYGLYRYGLYSYGLHNYGLHRYGLDSYCLHRYGLHRYGLNNYGLHGYGLHRYGLSSYGLHSYGLYSYGLHSYGAQQGFHSLGEGELVLLYEGLGRIDLVVLQLHIVMAYRVMG